jgi:two-component system, NtrC family, sensor kinase
MKAANATRAGTTDLQTVLRAIARTAAQVCEANDALIILLVEGDRAAVVARHGLLPIRHKLGETYPLTDDMVSNRSITQRRTIHLRDLVKAPRGRFLGSKAAHLHLGVRTMLVTPLLRDGNAIGAIGVRRMKVQPFTPKQVALLRTVANQAAIAIENARLSTELQEKNRELTNAHAQVTEALDQQTATSEILRVISSSPTDVQPVFDAIAEAAARLCEAFDAAIFHLEGERLRLVAHHGPIPTVGPVGQFTIPLVRGIAIGRSVLDGRSIHVADIETEAEEFPEGNEQLRRMGVRTILSVPLMREGVAIGAIGLRRTEVRPFTDQQISLLQTFADQAVIAIENVRLFKELEARNTDLTEALEQQTATSEILRVISSSPTDIQPVFDVIARSAATLCDALFASVNRFDGEFLHHVADYNVPAETLELISQNYPKRPDRTGTGSRAVLTRTVVHIPDILEDPEYRRDLAVTGGWRGMLSVPMLRGVDPIGSITIAKAEPSLFTDTQVALLQTFADQAVIAIENVRLFTELQASNRDLTDSLERQTATAEILRVIASSPTDLQPVFTAIAESAKRLLGGFSGSITRLIDNALHLGALTSTNPAGDDAARAMFPLPLTSAGIHSHAARTRAPFFVDMQTDPRLGDPRLQEMARARGWRSFLAVPMLQGNLVLGTIGVSRREPGGFKGGGDRAAPNLRGPSGDRHRERAPVHGTPGEKPSPHSGPRAGK